MKLQDEDLIERCRNDDRKAQNLLFEKYEKKVLGICIRYTASRDEAKDIQQEAFIKIFQNLKTSKEPIQSLSKWIYRITINSSIDYYRKQRRMDVHVDEIFLATEQPVILERLNEEELIGLIQQIPLPHRIIFNLYIIEGYSHKEIGEMLQIEESTSRSYLTRAKDFLKSRLVTSETKKGYG